jgi:hypothetical protein
MGIIIQSAEVAINKEAFKTVSSASLLGHMNLHSVEASSLPAEKKFVQIPPYIEESNHFLMMLGLAFNQHKCVQITPDNLWLLICQGFAQHIKLYPEKFRNLIGSKQEKITIEVRRDDFVKGKPNPWEEIFPEFTQKMQAHMTQDLYSKLVLKFSTTTLKESTAFEISFMEAMSNYFEFELISLCGIPEIHLEGTVEDYEKILDSCKSLFNFGIDPWLNKVITIIEKIMGAFKGETDFEFWSSIYKQNNESGGPYITGWILQFFPYIKYNFTQYAGVKTSFSDGLTKADMIKIIEEKKKPYSYNKEITALLKNPLIDGPKDLRLEPDNFHLGLSTVNFKWRYKGKRLPMKFVSGFVGIIEEDHILKSDINWMIIHADRLT